MDLKYTIYGLLLIILQTQTLPTFLFGFGVSSNRHTFQSPDDKRKTLAIYQQMEERILRKLHIAKETTGVVSDILYQGDIALRSEEAQEILESMKTRRKRKIRAQQKYRWKLPILYKFAVEKEFKIEKAAKLQIFEAIKHWEKETCVRFQEVSSTENEEPLLLFKQDSGCWSYVGKEDAFKFQEISLGSHCEKLGTVIHELGHAVGFWHEHSRPDRDKYIKVNYKNIRIDEYYNFDTESWRYLDNQNISYDIGSIMHYGPTDFGVTNKSITIQTRDPLMQSVPGQRRGLSFYDSKEANLAYCSQKCTKSSVKGKCLHEGYPDPNDCDKCRCPDGLAGNLCEEVAPSVGLSCGGQIEIQSKEKYTIGTPNYPNRYQANEECTWRIKTRPGRKVYLTFYASRFMMGSTCKQNHQFQVCEEDYVEVKYRLSPGATGARFCCGKVPLATIVSSNDTMYVLFRSLRGGKFGFKATVTMSPDTCGGCHNPTRSKELPCVRATSKVCTRTWTRKEYVPCTNAWGSMWRLCDYTRKINESRPAICHDEEPFCCGNYKLVKNMCVLSAEEYTQAPVTHEGDIPKESGSGPQIGHDVTTGWSPWSSWSNCSKTCGGCGTRNRSRTCDNTSSCGGRSLDIQTESCNNGVCSEYYFCTKKKMVKFCTFMYCNGYKYISETTMCKFECCKGYVKSKNVCIKSPS